MMRKAELTGIIFSFCLILIPAFCEAQRSEVGFGLGTFTYVGDLARTYSFSNSEFAGTVFYRSNLSKVVSFRVSATAGSISGTDSRPIDAFAKERNASFNLFLFEASSVMEYHFLNWRDERRMLRATPYMFAGLALFGLSGDVQKNTEYSNIQPAIPFGAGIKYVINPLWYLSLEFGMRKTFFDYIDNVSAGKPGTKNYQYGFTHDNDKYFFLGLTLTRTFYSIPCPKNPYK
jgi:hypothetical protein